MPSKTAAMLVIHWSITDQKIGKNRRGALFPHLGESWRHMARFLKATGSDEFLTAYSLDSRGQTLEYNDIDFAEEDLSKAEGWFTSK